MWESDFFFQWCFDDDDREGRVKAIHVDHFILL